MLNKELIVHLLDTKKGPEIRTGISKVEKQNLKGQVSLFV